MSLYHPEQIQKFYDEYGLKEWNRFSWDLEGFINFEIHRSFLDRFIGAGDCVLDIGAGPGRFTIELARRGAKIGVADISREQIRLNQEKVMEFGFEKAILFRSVADVVDLSTLPVQSFDAVVCFGGPLSYVFDKADQSVNEMHRVLKPGGILLVSVMSLLGAMRRFLPGVIDLGNQIGMSANSETLRTGDLSAEHNKGHGMRMYRWSALRDLLERNGFEILSGACSNFLSVQNGDALKAQLEINPGLKNQVLTWELQVCEDPGVVDSGTHIIAVARKS